MICAKCCVLLCTTSRYHNLPFFTLRERSRPLLTYSRAGTFSHLHTSYQSPLIRYTVLHMSPSSKILYDRNYKYARDRSSAGPSSFGPVLFFFLSDLQGPKVRSIIRGKYRAQEISEQSITGCEMSI